MSKRILVLGCYEHTLTISRSLTRSGHHVILGVTSEELEVGYVQHSRSVASTWRHPDIVNQPAAFDTALLDYLKTHSPVDAIFPIGEDDIRRVACIRNGIPKDVTVIMPSNSAIAECLNKENSNRLARACNIPTAETCTVQSAGELRLAVKQLGLPAIAKPAESTHLLLNKKCVFIRSDTELENLCSNWHEVEGDIIVQNEIAGVRHNCDIVAENGKIKRYFEARILRTDQLDGAGNSVLDQSIPPVPIHEDYCQRMVESLNYTGMALFQFLRDPQSGETCFLEVNPRSGAAISLAVGCGLELPADAVVACYGASLEFEEKYPRYKTRHCVHDDIQGLRKAHVYREVSFGQTVAWIGRICHDAVCADLYSTLAWNDLRPTLKIYWNMLLRLVGKTSGDSTSDIIHQNVDTPDGDYLALQSSSTSGVFRRIDSVPKEWR